MNNSAYISSRTSLQAGSLAKWKFSYLKAWTHQSEIKEVPTMKADQDVALERISKTTPSGSACE